MLFMAPLQVGLPRQPVTKGQDGCVPSASGLKFTKMVVLAKSVQ